MAEVAEVNVDRGDELVEEAPIESVVTDEEVEQVVGKAEEEPVVEEKEDDEPRIPKKRLDAVIGRAKAREEASKAEIEQLRSRLTEYESSLNNAKFSEQLSELEAKYDTAMKEGDFEEVAKLSKQLREQERKAYAAYTAEMVKQVETRTTEQMKYDSVVATLEASYPQIDPESEEYDEDTVQNILFDRDAFVSKGLSAAKALERAVRYNLGNPATKVVEEVKAGVRKEEAVKRNLEAAKKQPPKMEVGLDHDKKGGGLDAKTVMKLDYKEFSKLSEDVLARLRGDEM